MRKKDRNESGIASVYAQEYQFLEQSRQFLEIAGTSAEDLKNAFAGLVDEYGKLLRLISKITHVGDANQRKLFQAYDQIERQKEALSEAYTKMELLAHTDPLTQLSNRRDFLQKFQNELHRFERSQKPFSVIMADIDHFKQFNDRYGHDCGDFVLQRTAEILRDSLRKQDLICRWGGEEFILLLPDSSHNGALIVAENLRRRISEYSCDYKDFTVSITMTFGVCCYEYSLSIDGCIKKADQALYHGKQDGRNCVVSADDLK